MNKEVKLPRPAVVAHTNGTLSNVTLVHETASNWYVTEVGRSRKQRVNKNEGQRAVFDNVIDAMDWQVNDQLAMTTAQGPDLFYFTPAEIRLLQREPDVLYRLIKLTMSKERCAAISEEINRLREEAYG